MCEGGLIKGIDMCSHPMMNLISKAWPFGEQE
jgi:hypothetical protein